MTSILKESDSKYDRLVKAVAEIKKELEVISIQLEETKEQQAVYCQMPRYINLFFTANYI